MLDFDSGRWRFLQLHRRPPCFREVEVSSPLLSSALVSGGWKRSLPCVAGSWFPSSVLGFVLFFYICLCGFGLDLMEELSSEDDRSSPVIKGDVSAKLSSQFWWWMEADEISYCRLILSDIGNTWVESVCGEEVVELVSAGVSQWINGWFTGGGLKRGWGRGS